MTKTRTGDAWMPADDYGRSLPRFSLNLLVRDVARSLPFYRDVLGATIRYADGDFAALALQGVDFMLHADHTYDHHPLYARLNAQGLRGTGAEIRVLGIDPDAAEARAKASGAVILQPATNFPHGWRDVILVDPDGYTWAVGVTLPKDP
jgi:predicted enzyme related to lactoylglutathione lyase